MAKEQSNFSTENCTIILPSDQDDHQLFDLIDRLRQLGIETEIESLRVIVVGSQPTGKGSIINAICRFNVPKESVACTRFALEVVIRHASEASWSIELVPTSSRSPEDREKLNAFGTTVKSRFTDPQKHWNDIVGLADQISGMSDATGIKGFANYILKLKWFGPGLPNFDLVDLTRLSNGTGANQSAADASYKREVIEGYMSRPLTIFLIIISGQVSVTNQQKTTLAKKRDNEGAQTRGSITKPDTTEETRLHKEVIEPTRNKTIPIRCAYHILKRHDWKTQNDSNDQRNLDEAEILATPPFNKVDAAHKGITSLGPRLNNNYREQIMKSMPRILSDGKVNLQSTQAELDAIVSVNNSSGKRDELSDIAHRAIKDMSSAIDGGFNDLHLDNDDAIQVNSKIGKLINASVEQLRSCGTWYNTGRKSTVRVNSNILDNKALIDTMLAEYTSSGIPGQFDTRLTQRLCKAQTEQWLQTAEKLIDDIVTACNDCIEAVLAKVCPNQTAKAIFGIVCLRITDQILQTFTKDVQGILPKFDELDGTQVFDPAIIAKAIGYARAKETISLIKFVHNVETCPGANVETQHQFVGDDGLVETVQEKLSLARTTFAEAVECARLHCQSELERVINYFTMHKVKTQLWGPFRAAFTIEAFRELSDSQVDFILGDTDEVKEKKRAKQEEIGKLRKVLDSLQDYAVAASATLDPQQQT